MRSLRRKSNCYLTSFVVMSLGLAHLPVTFGDDVVLKVGSKEIKYVSNVIVFAHHKDAVWYVSGENGLIWEKAEFCDSTKGEEFKTIFSKPAELSGILAKMGALTADVFDVSGGSNTVYCLAFDFFPPAGIALARSGTGGKNICLRDGQHTVCSPMENILRLSRKGDTNSVRRTDGSTVTGPIVPEYAKSSEGKYVNLEACFSGLCALGPNVKRFHMDLDKVKEIIIHTITTNRSEIDTVATNKFVAPKLELRPK